MEIQYDDMALKWTSARQEWTPPKTLSIAQTEQQPIVVLKSLLASGWYTLMLIDVDAENNMPEKGQYQLHWLIIDMAVNFKNSPKGGPRNLVPYYRPFLSLEKEELFPKLVGHLERLAARRRSIVLQKEKEEKKQGHTYFFLLYRQVRGPLRHSTLGKDVEMDCSLNGRKAFLLDDFVLAHSLKLLYRIPMMINK